MTIHNCKKKFWFEFTNSKSYSLKHGQKTWRTDNEITISLSTSSVIYFDPNFNIIGSNRQRLQATTPVTDITLTYSKVGNTVNCHLLHNSTCVTRKILHIFFIFIDKIVFT
jgi:hypothetical protein